MLRLWKQLQSSFAVSRFASVEQQVLKVQGLTCASCKSLQDFISQLIIAKECLKVYQCHYLNRTTSYNFSEASADPSKHGHTKYTTRVSINSISPLSAQRLSTKNSQSGVTQPCFATDGWKG